MNLFKKRGIAKKLPKQIQVETMYAAREHMLKQGKHSSWSIPDTHGILEGKTDNQQIGMSVIWFEVVHHQ